MAVKCGVARRLPGVGIPVTQQNLICISSCSLIQTFTRLRDFQFEDIIAEDAPNYEKFDVRKVPESCKVLGLPYITRGQAVRSIKRCL